MTGKIPQWKEQPKTGTVRGEPERAFPAAEGDGKKSPGTSFAHAHAFFWHGCRRHRKQLKEGDVLAFKAAERSAFLPN